MSRTVNGRSWFWQNVRTLIGGQFRTSHLKHSLCDVKCAEQKSAHHHPLTWWCLHLLWFCSVLHITYTMCYLMYTMGDCIVLPVVNRWCAVGFLYLTSVCHALNPTAGSTRKEWNHTPKLRCITISCHTLLYLWYDWFLTDRELRAIEAVVAIWHDQMRRSLVGCLCLIQSRGLLSPSSIHPIFNKLQQQSIIVDW